MAMDYYRLLNVTRTATTKEIKDAYFKLGACDAFMGVNTPQRHHDIKKAELFKNVSEAHAVLSDAQQRRQYDASRPMHSFDPQSTGGGRMHPYAAQKAAEAAARGYNGAPDYTARPLYGIDEEVWIAHHYGVHSRRSRNDMPNRYYGMNIVEERMEEEQERIQR
uniref:J domain-containing protein n=1 Tax=Globisporangium ultimum (strain ATCC 200006 / CBS 805.95 / DAOM BR144) TaxID=431595 RepID=K3W4Z9_GLOUD